MAAAERKERYDSIKAKMVGSEQVSTADAQFVTLYEGMMAVAEQVAADRAAEKAAALAEMNARTPEEIERTNRAIDFEAQSLDRVGLNIAGEAVEAEPEMKPLTEDDKNVLDFVASNGASVQALAEIERDMRTSTDATPSTTQAAKFGVTEHTVAVKSNPAVQFCIDWDNEVSMQVTVYCDALKESILHDSEYTFSVTYNSKPRVVARAQFVAMVNGRIAQAKRNPRSFFSVFDDLRGN